ncbi:MAG: response regulator [Chitinophagaceae bacterium]|nr:MAG: response regulator [Chitinophagaceae bacterium]
MIKDKTLYQILIVEDNPGDRILVADLLEEQLAAPRITFANNFKEAEEALSNAAIRFDAILLDLSLPDKSGKELVTQMLDVAGGVPVIILTGHSDIEFSVQSISLGVLDYLIKDDLSSGVLYKSLIHSIERKRLNAALTASEKRYSDLFHLSPQPMWVLDANSLQFLQVNKAATELYGYTEEEFLHVTLHDIKAEQDLYTLDYFTEHNQLPPSFSGSVKHKTKSGAILEMEITTTPMVINDRQVRSVVALDVTQKKLYEHEITKAIIRTQERERYDIGAELHDNVCQILVATQLHLGILKPGLNEHSLEMYEHCDKNIQKALAEIRHLSHRLAPAFFDDSKLDEAFKTLLHDFLINSKHKVSLNVSDAVKHTQFNQDVHLNVYRILQEQLRNILKYAKANSITVDVLIEEQNLKLLISDDGVGFDQSQPIKAGIGMANMQRRAELFGGHFEIRSAPGQGCTS